MRSPVGGRAATRQSVIFGWGTIHRAGPHISRVARRPLVLTGRASSRRSGVLDSLHESILHCGAEPVLFEGIGPEPQTDIVDAAASVAREARCDAIVALGGGSVLDAAKAVAACVGSDRSCWEYTRWGRSDPAPVARIEYALPVVSVPTVTGSGSEVNGTGVLWHPSLGEKAVFFDRRLIPRLAIVDPSLTVTVDPVQTVAGAMDIIAHALEDHLSRADPAPMQRDRAATFIGRVLAMAARAARSPLDRHARTALARSAIEVWDGTYSGRHTPWTLHAIAHVVGARTETGHSLVIGTLLPGWLEFVENKDPSRLQDLPVDAVQSLSTTALLTDAHTWDCDRFARETVAIYGVEGTMPGWPGLTRADVVTVLENAVRLTAASTHRKPLAPI